MFKPKTDWLPPKIRLLIGLLWPHVPCDGNFDGLCVLMSLVVSSIGFDSSENAFSKGQHTFVIPASCPQKDFFRKAMTEGMCLWLSSNSLNFLQCLIFIQMPFSLCGVLHSRVKENQQSHLSIWQRVSSSNYLNTIFKKNLPLLGLAVFAPSMNVIMKIKYCSFLMLTCKW